MSDISIRPIVREDFEVWSSLWAGYLAFYETALDEAVTAATWQRLLAVDVPIHGLAAVNENGGVIGFLHYVLHDYTWDVRKACYLEDLYVDERLRGSGAGRRLIDALIEIGKRENWGRIYWLTQAHNARARALYDTYVSATDFVNYRIVLS